jgi:hypothetical protein
MKPKIGLNKSSILLSFVIFFSILTLSAQNTFTEYKGIVIDSDSQNPLESVNITVKNSNISTFTNTEGEFVLKVPESNQGTMIVLSLLGYEVKEISLNVLSKEDSKISMSLKAIELPQVNVTEFKSAEALVVKMFESKSKNYLDQPVLMTAFYRETIKKRNRNVSLTEAVVDLYKQSYQNRSRDVMKLHKARKSTDYKALDTLAFKLQGGPFSTLYLDIMKYPEFIFSDESIKNYNYTFDQPTTVNNKLVYVVNFVKKLDNNTLGFYGKLYIDANSLALTSATYALNIEDKVSAADFFVKKKPSDVITYPTETSYKVNYQEKEGKWYYSYASVNLTFKVNKKRKLFNSVYSISSEMAITDWELTSSSENKDLLKDRLRPSMIISDEVSGFSDLDFWGAYNLIEPDKSIESAIDKIRKKLKREN